MDERNKKGILWGPHLIPAVGVDGDCSEALYFGQVAILCGGEERIFELLAGGLHYSL